MMAKAATQQYILMPRDGLRDRTMLDPLLQPDRQPKFLQAMTMAQPKERAPKPVKNAIRVIDSIHADGLKLAELTPEAVFNLRATLPGVRVVPVVHYRTADNKYQIESVLKKGTRAAGELRVTVRCRSTNAPLAGSKIIAFTNFAAREGASATTDKDGVAVLAQKHRSLTLERLLIYPPHHYWGFYSSSLRISDGNTFTLKQIELADPDFLTDLYRGYPAMAGTGVTVGVLDTGVTKNHPDLSVAAARNMVTGEDPADGGPANDHGTHVAGIIASRGTLPTGKRGVAPGTTLRSYRVFGKGAARATNYDIAKAIDQAVADGCHLLNLSVNSPTRDPAVGVSLDHAYRAGVLAICATGNDYRKPVGFPAAFQQALAVSALGQKLTFPADSLEAGEIVAPFATSDRSRFIGAFSNVGQEVALTGPGVGIISTVPDRDYAVMSGTSMACPAVTGCISALLSGQPDLLEMSPDASRTAAFTRLALTRAVQQGLGSHMEGHGLLS